MAAKTRSTEPTAVNSLQAVPQSMTTGQRLVWLGFAVILVVQTSVWGFQLLPERIGRAVVDADRLLFLQGPALAAAHRTAGFGLLYVFGVGTCALLLRSVMRNQSWY